MKKLLLLGCLLPCFLQAETPELEIGSARAVGSILLYPLTLTQLKPEEVTKIIDETIREFKIQENSKIMEQLMSTLQYYKDNKDARIKRLVDSGIPQEEALKFVEHSIESLEGLVKLVRIGFPLDVARKIVEKVPEAIPYIMSRPTFMDSNGMPLSSEYMSKFQEITIIKEIKS